MTRSKTLFALFATLLLFTLAGCFSLAEDITPPPGAELPSPALETPEIQPTAIVAEGLFPTNLPDPNLGAEIYFNKCASCHGEEGMGDGPDSRLLDNPIPALGSAFLARKSTPADWYTMVTQGNMGNFMPPFTSLSDQERWDVVAYLYALSTPPELIAEGELLFIKECAECHGEDGSKGAVYFKDPAVMGKRTAEDMAAVIVNGQGQMPPFDDFSENEIWALTAYLRSLTFAPSEGNITEISEVELKTQDSDTSSTTEVEAPGGPATGDRFGTITVNIVNASSDLLPANLKVTLRGYDEMTEVFTQTLNLAEGSDLTFEGVPLHLERMYFATMEHANAVYGSDVFVVETGSPDELALEIPYYSPTSDASIIHVDRLHVFISFVDEKTLEIFQLYIFSNPTSQILVPAEDAEAAVNFVIPTDARNLYVEDSMNMAYTKTSDGFGIVNIYPEETAYQTVFSYQIPYEDRKLNLSIPISMNANAVILMAPAKGLKVKSDQLEDAGSRDFEGISYNMYTGINLDTGDTLDLTLSGHSNTSAVLFASEDGSNTSMVIGLAGLGVTLIVAGVILWYRNRVSEDEEGEGDWEDDFLGESAEDVMDAIITLDDRYRTGGLPEGAYHVRRTELMERLREIIQNESNKSIL
jgi:mono/diheme cytochrome c family protein